MCAAMLALSAGVARAEERAAPLPLRSVRLYEVGLGYFERTGRLGNASDLALPVPASHLDDALKTLVVLGTDGKTSVAGIEFASSVSPEMGRALAGLPAGEDTITYASLLRSLKGAAVELKIQGPANAESRPTMIRQETLRGRLIDVVEPAATDVSECIEEANPAPDTKREAAAACARARQMALLVLTDRGEIRRLRSSEVSGIRPTDRGVAARIGAGLDALTTQVATAQKKLRVLATSTSDVTVGYVAEAPVWRSSYRVVLDNQGGGILQGWALIHNDTDEDWKQVRVELVNGQPDSFLFPLAAPRYGRRELVTPENELSTVPQLLGRTVDTMWGDEIGESFGVGGLGLTGVGEGGGGGGEGIGLGTIGTIGHGSGTGSGQSSLLSVGNLASIAPADAVESGALFRYALPSAIDLRAHGSALVPFVQRPVGARRIAHFEHPDEAARSAARFKNDTGQTLPSGTIAFFADGGFAGEATVPRLTPGEHRILAFGADLDVELNRRAGTFKDETRLVTYDDGAVVEHFIRRHRVDYDVINKSASGRTVFLTLDYVNNARVRGADELDFDTATHKALAVFNIDAKTQRTRQLDVEEGLTRRHPIATLDAKHIFALATETKVPPTQRAILRTALDRMKASEDWSAEIPRIDRAIKVTLGDLARLRAHLSAAGQDAEDSEPFVQRILAAEDRLRALRGRAAQAKVIRARRYKEAIVALKRLGSGPARAAAP